MQGKSYFIFMLLFEIFFVFWVVSGLHCCTQAFSSCREQGLLFVRVLGLLIVVASLVGKHRLSSCDPLAKLFLGMWNVSRSGIEPGSPALMGRFLTTGPPGKILN